MLRSARARTSASTRRPVTPGMPGAFSRVSTASISASRPARWSASALTAARSFCAAIRARRATRWTSLVFCCATWLQRSRTGAALWCATDRQGRAYRQPSSLRPLLTACVVESCAVLRSSRSACVWRLSRRPRRGRRPRRSGRQTTGSSCGSRWLRRAQRFAPLSNAPLSRAAPPRRPSARWTAGRCPWGASAACTRASFSRSRAALRRSCVIVRDGVVVAAGSNSPNVTRNVRRRRERLACCATRSAPCLLERALADSLRVTRSGDAPRGARGHRRVARRARRGRRRGRLRPVRSTSFARGNAR